MPLSLTLLILAQSQTIPAPSPASVLLDDTKPYYRQHSAPACSDWTSSRTGKTDDSRLLAAIYKNWTLGYVSGFNVVGPDPTGNLLGTSSLPEFFQAIDGYCSRNPSHSVEASMRPIADAIIRRRGVPAATPPTPQQRKNATVHAPTTCNEWMQRREDAVVRPAYVMTLHGYITAHNRWSNDPHGDAIGADRDGALEPWIDVWCPKHPTSLLYIAVSPLIDHITAERMAGRLPPGGIRPSDVVEGNDAIQK